jgi:hypothetical protein
MRGGRLLSIICYFCSQGKFGDCSPKIKHRLHMKQTLWHNILIPIFIQSWYPSSNSDPIFIQFWCPSSSKFWYPSSSNSDPHLHPNSDTHLHPILSTHFHPILIPIFIQILIPIFMVNMSKGHAEIVFFYLVPFCHFPPLITINALSRHLLKTILHFDNSIPCGFVHWWAWAQY